MLWNLLLKDFDFGTKLSFHHEKMYVLKDIGIKDLGFFYKVWNVRHIFASSAILSEECYIFYLANYRELLSLTFWQKNIDKKYKQFTKTWKLVMNQASVFLYLSKLVKDKFCELSQIIKIKLSNIDYSNSQSIINTSIYNLGHFVKMVGANV